MWPRRRCRSSRGSTRRRICDAWKRGSMTDLRPSQCPISGGTDAQRVFVYDAPPPGEIGFPRPAGEPYRREGWQFAGSNHFVSRHAMTVATQYDGAYVDATYQGDAGLATTFDRIISLPPE